MTNLWIKHKVLTNKRRRISMHTLMMPDDYIRSLYALKKELCAVYSMKAASQQTLQCLNSGTAV